MHGGSAQTSGSDLSSGTVSLVSRVPYDPSVRNFAFLIQGQVDQEAESCQFVSLAFVLVCSDSSGPSMLPLGILRDTDLGQGMWLCLWSVCLSCLKN